VKECSASITAKPHGRPRTEEDSGNRHHNLDEGDDQHDETDSPDVSRIAFGYPLVNDVSVKSREVQASDGLNGLKDNDNDKQVPVRDQFVFQQPSQHLNFVRYNYLA
jgi:hypothetical protein